MACVAEGPDAAIDLSDGFQMVSYSEPHEDFSAGSVCETTACVSVEYGRTYIHGNLGYLRELRDFSRSLAVVRLSDDSSIYVADFRLDANAFDPAAHAMPMILMPHSQTLSGTLVSDLSRALGGAGERA